MNDLKKDSVSKLTQVKKGKNKYARCFVTRDGFRKEIHLGRWGTEEVEKAYRRLLAEVYSDVPREAPEPAQITLSELFGKYLEYAELRKDFRDISNTKTIIGLVAQVYPDMEVGKFTAMPYRTVQSYLVRIAPSPPSGREWSRHYVNLLMKILRSVFKWGISYDLVPPEVLAKIQSVPVVKKGEYPWLKETKKRKDVPDEAVLQTLLFLPPTVADMV